MNNQEERVLSPTEPTSKDIPTEFGDNFAPNSVNEPSKSDWDTTPTTSTIKFFGGMVEEERRRGLFGDDEPKGGVENEGGNGNDNTKQEVTFGFHILDLTRGQALYWEPKSYLLSIYKGENEPTGQALQGAQKKPCQVRS